MKKLLVFITLLGLVGCAEKKVQRPTTQPAMCPKKQVHDPLDMSPKHGTGFIPEKKPEKTSKYKA